MYYRAWRLKLVLLYCFAGSVATAAGFVLKMASTLALNWNHQFYLDPVPFHLSIASPVLLGLQGFWNLHVVALLVLLSRVSSNSAYHDYVKPAASHSFSRDNTNDEAQGNYLEDGDADETVEQCITHEEYLEARPQRGAEYSPVATEDYLVSMTYDQQQQQQRQHIPAAQADGYSSDRMPDYAREYFQQHQQQQEERQSAEIDEQQQQQVRVSAKVHVCRRNFSFCDVLFSAVLQPIFGRGRRPHGPPAAVRAPSRPCEGVFGILSRADARLEPIFQFFPFPGEHSALVWLPLRGPS